MLCERHTHGRVYICREGIPADRASFEVAIGDQARLRFRLFLVKIGDLLFPDLTGAVNSVLSLFMGIFQIERALVFHTAILRRQAAV